MDETTERTDGTEVAPGWTLRRGHGYTAELGYTHAAPALMHGGETVAALLHDEVWFYGNPDRIPVVALQALLRRAGAL
jgi:hypothetical protein